MVEEPAHDRPAQMAGEVIPDENEPQGWQRLTGLAAQPRLPLSRSRPLFLWDRDLGERSQDEAQLLLQPRMKDGVRRTSHALGPHFASGWSEQRQQLARTISYIFMRLPSWFALGCPVLPWIGNRLIGACLILITQDNAGGFRRPIGQFDHPLFCSVAGSTTVTTPLLRTRCAVPVGHQLRVFW